MHKSMRKRLEEEEESASALEYLEVRLLKVSQEESFIIGKNNMSSLT
jgi:hypothetical protein